MQKTEPIVIQLSKVKITLMFIGSLLFVALGLWFVVSPATFKDTPIYNHTLIICIGVIAVLLFSLFGSMSIKKMRDSTPGIIINDEGIVDNSSGVSAGLVLWTDITAVKVADVMNQQFIMLIIKNPQTYIERHTSLMTRKAVEFNYKTYGSPVSITANGLKCNFKELLAMVEERFKEAKQA